MTTAAPARLIEEYDKVLRSGAAEPTFSAMAEHRLLEPITPELQRSAQNPALRDALAALDAYRGEVRRRAGDADQPDPAGNAAGAARLDASPRVIVAMVERRWKSGEASQRTSGPSQAATAVPKEPILKIGSLPIARRDTERLRQVLAFQRRLADLEMSARAKRGLLGRSSFHDALTWIEIHGNSPGVLEHWRGFIEALGPEALERTRATAEAPAGEDDRERPAGRRRRGRRRRGGRRRFNRPPE